MCCRVSRVTQLRLPNSSANRQQCVSNMRLPIPPSASAAPISRRCGSFPCPNASTHELHIVCWARSAAKMGSNLQSLFKCLRLECAKETLWTFVEHVACGGTLAPGSESSGFAEVTRDRESWNRSPLYLGVVACAARLYGTVRARVLVKFTGRSTLTLASPFFVAIVHNCVRHVFSIGRRFPSAIDLSQRREIDQAFLQQSKELVGLFHQRRAYSELTAAARES